MASGIHKMIIAQMFFGVKFLNLRARRAFKNCLPAQAGTSKPAASRSIPVGLTISVPLRKQGSNTFIEGFAPRPRLRRDGFPDEARFDGIPVAEQSNSYLQPFLSYSTQRSGASSSVSAQRPHTRHISSWRG